MGEPTKTRHTLTRYVRHDSRTSTTCDPAGPVPLSMTVPMRENGKQTQSMKFSDCPLLLHKRKRGKESHTTKFVSEYKG